MNFFEAELAIEGIERSHRPRQAGSRIGRLQPKLLSEVALLVGGASGRAVILQSCREMHAGSVEQREGRGACRQQSLIVTEVVQGTGLAAHFVAVEIGGCG